VETSVRSADCPQPGRNSSASAGSSARSASVQSLLIGRGGGGSKATDPALQLRTELLIWQIREQKLIGDRPVQIDRYKVKPLPTAPRRILRVNENQGRHAQTECSVEVEPPRHSKQFHELEPEQGNCDCKPARADGASPKQVTLTAKQGRMDLQKEVVYLTGDVHGVGSDVSPSMKGIFPVNWLKPMAMLFIVRLNPTRVYRSKAVGKIKTKPLSSVAAGW